MAAQGLRARAFCISGCSQRRPGAQRTSASGRLRCTLRPPTCRRRRADGVSKLPPILKLYRSKIRCCPLACLCLITSKHVRMHDAGGVPTLAQSRKPPPGAGALHARMTGMQLRACAPAAPPVAAAAAAAAAHTGAPAAGEPGLPDASGAHAASMDAGSGSRAAQVEPPGEGSSCQASARAAGPSPAHASTWRGGGKLSALQEGHEQ